MGGDHWERIRLARGAGRGTNTRFAPTFALTEVAKFDSVSSVAAMRDHLFGNDHRRSKLLSPQRGMFPSERGNRTATGEGVGVTTSLAGLRGG